MHEQRAGGQSCRRETGPEVGRDDEITLVLDGPQGIGKSFLVRWLCPKERYYIEGGINTEDKDSLIRLASKWIWEVGELQATTRKADREALKDFISRRDVTVRPAYGRYDIVKPALASFIVTINELSVETVRFELSVDSTNKYSLEREVAEIRI